MANQQSKLLTLPRELRDIIYEYIFPEVVCLMFRGNSYATISGKNHNMGITRVCRQTHAETIKLYYQNTIFQPQSIAIADIFILGLPDEYRNSLTTVRMYHHQPGENSHMILTKLCDHTRNCESQGKTLNTGVFRVNGCLESDSSDYVLWLGDFTPDPPPEAPYGLSRHTGLPLLKWSDRPTRYKDLAPLTPEERKELHRKGHCFRCRKDGHYSTDPRCPLEPYERPRMSDDILCDPSIFAKFGLQEVWAASLDDGKLKRLVLRYKHQGRRWRVIQIEDMKDRISKNQLIELQKWLWEDTVI